MLPTLSARIEQDMAQQRIAWDREKEEQRKRVEAARLKATLAPEERMSSMQAAELRQATTEDLVSVATAMPASRNDTVVSIATEENTSTDILDGAVTHNDEDNLRAQTPATETDLLLRAVQSPNKQVRTTGETARKEQGNHESIFPLPPPRPDALSGTVKRSSRPTSSKKTSGKIKRKLVSQNHQLQIQQKQHQVNKTVDAACESIDVESAVSEKQSNEVKPKRTADTDLDESSAENIAKSKNSPTLLPTTTIISDSSAPIIPISLAAAAMSRKVLLPPIGKSGTTAAAAEVTSLGKSLDSVSRPVGRKEGLSDVRDSAVCVVE
ncbi:hypothetical protein HDU81_007469 [Chytriomyces hyalinus]|nr:hypothetical protein HDU81_007469 [Chytriomyces hyalinus]